MARTADGPRKKEFVGIPIDRVMKQRLKRVARFKDKNHTELAREYVVAGVEKDEPAAIAAAK